MRSCHSSGNDASPSQLHPHYSEQLSLSSPHPSVVSHVLCLAGFAVLQNMVTFGPSSKSGECSETAYLDEIERFQEDACQCSSLSENI